MALALAGWVGHSAAADPADLTEKPLSEDLFEQRKIPIESEVRISAAGFIARSVEPEGRILGLKLPTDRTLIEKHDVVYVRFSTSANPSPGDQFSIVRAEKKVGHPVRRGKVGTLVEILGEGEVLASEGDRTEFRVTRSFEPIHSGDPLIRKPVKAPVRMDPDKPVGSKEIEGYIVAAKGKSGDLGEEDVVYLDVGTEKGIELGDHFSVHLGPKHQDKKDKKNRLERTPLGELQVIFATPTTSTAVITESKTGIQVGDRVRFVENR
jgi:hypothetical protein